MSDVWIWHRYILHECWHIQINNDQITATCMEFYCTRIYTNPVRSTYLVSRFASICSICPSLSSNKRTALLTEKQMKLECLTTVVQQYTWRSEFGTTPDDVTRQRVYSKRVRDRFMWRLYGYESWDLFIGFFFISLEWVKLSPLCTLTTNWPTSPALDDWRWAWLVSGMIGKEMGVHG